MCCAGPGVCISMPLAPGAPKSVSGWSVACGLFSSDFSDSLGVSSCINHVQPLSHNPSRSSTPLSVARLRLVRCGSLGFAKTVGNSDDVQTSSLVTSTLSCHVSLTSHTLYSSHSLYVYGFTDRVGLPRDFYYLRAVEDFQSRFLENGLPSTYF